jgi:hypothetical protein
MSKGIQRALAVVSLAAFLGVLPETAIMHSAEPVTLGDWLRQIFVTVDREIDRTAMGVAASSPPPPPAVLQTSSEQTPPRQSVDRSRLPDGWVRQSSRRTGRRRRRGR